MDCTGIADHLVGYHFATLDEPARDAIDAHLLGCTGCLGGYLALKRAAERAERPSPALKARLRESVRAEFPKKKCNVTLLARRIPLYQGLVAAAVAAAIAFAAPSLLQGTRTRAIREGTPRIDSARSRAEAFQIY